MKRLRDWEYGLSLPDGMQAWQILGCVWLVRNLLSVRFWQFVWVMFGRHRWRAGWWYLRHPVERMA